MRILNVFIVLLLSISLSVAQETPAPTQEPTAVPADTPTPVPTEAPPTATPVPADTPASTPVSAETPAATPAPQNDTAATPTPSTSTSQCSTASDGACPSGCSAGSDYDCCIQSGKQWVTERGCYEKNAATEPNVECSATKDGACPSWCSAGSDYDCCLQKPGYSWKEGGCYSESTQTTQPACPQLMPPGADFCVNGKIKHKYDEKGCVAGYECEQYDDKGCAKYPEPECTNGYIVGGGTKPGQSCPSQPTCCGNSVCEGTENYVNCKSDCTQPVCGDFKCDPGEDKFNCPSDCKGGRGGVESCSEGPGPVCGVNGKTYPNICEARKANVEVKFKGDCVPEGCRGERDENGFFRVICEEEQRCPDVPYGADKPCREKGGNPVWMTDRRGCKFIDCQFVQESRGQIFKTYESCLSQQELESIKSKCEGAGLPFLVKNAGNDCMIAKCGGEEKSCPAIALTEKRRVEGKCASEGLFIVEEYDESGCRFLKCSDDCKRDVPPEAYQKCNSKGGELILQRDEQGCVMHDECVRPGEEEVYVDEITELPKPAELLAMAFKLEDLKIQLDKLARQTEQIASYYKSTNSPEEQRFMRVSDMFDSGKDKVDEIKEKLRSRIKDLTIDDMVEIRQDIRYIKDVLIRDIVYVMLGSGDEIDELKEGNLTDCGTDGSCFDRAIRICKPVQFRPEGRTGPTVELKGLEGDKCIMYAVLPEGQGPPAGTVTGINPPYDMTCKIPNYSFGVKGPEDFMQYCEGPLLQLMKQFGTEPKQQSTQTRSAQPRTSQRSSQPSQFGGGGGFGEEEFGEPGFEDDFGGSQQQFGGGFEEQGFNQPAQPVRRVQPQQGGGFVQQPSGSRQKCPDGICDAFEQANPGECPQDCGFESTSSSSGVGGGFAQPVSSGGGGGFGAPAPSGSFGGGIGEGGYETGQFGGGF